MNHKERAEDDEHVEDIYRCVLPELCVGQPVEISDRGSENNVDYYLFCLPYGHCVGFLVGMIRSTYEKTHKLKVLNAICKVYLTVIRGTLWWCSC